MEFDYACQPGMREWDLNYVNNAVPLISIITAFYNDSEKLLQTACCVKNQTFPYFEWIIVDDGSTRKEALSLLEQVEKSDPRFRVLHKENGGPSAARNYGVRHAVTDFILPLDSDDLIEPPFLEYCWWMLKRNPGAAWAYTGSVGFGSQEYLWDVPFDPIRLKRENHLTITALIRKDAFLSVGGYEERRNYNEDWQFWLKLVARGNYPAQSRGEYLFWYRRSDTGELSTVWDGGAHERQNRKLIAKVAAEVKKPKPPVLYPCPDTFEWAAPVTASGCRPLREKKEKCNILFLFPHLVMGGADKFNLDLIAGLDPKQFEAGIISMVPSENTWLQRFRQVTPNIFNLPNFLEPKDYAEFISSYIQSRQVDILFLSNAYHGYALLPWLRQQFPDLAIVDYVHMEEWYWRAGGYARTSGVYGSITEKTYVCNSGTENVLISNFGRKPETVETVHIGVDNAYFSKDQVVPGKLYEELKIEKDRPIVLFICRMHPQKRPFLMLEIAKRVKKQLPNVAFVAVGDGPQLQELRNRSRHLNLSQTVYFLGAKKEVRPYYRDAKLSLVCSLKEGLSLTAYESCAVGVPVISADVGGQKDLVDDRVGALILCQQSEADSFDTRTFPEEEVRAYVDSICTLLTDQAKWQAASEACQERIRQGFTIRNMVEHFEQEFLRLVTDADAADKRCRVAEALALCGPVAAETYVLEMQLQKTEDEFVQEASSCDATGESLLRKAKFELQQNGFHALIRKVFRYIRKKLL